MKRERFPTSPIHRVLQIHTRYRQAGGEDQVVEAEKHLLEAAAIEVDQLLFDNADLRDSESLVGDGRLAIDAVWSRSAERRVRRWLSARRPDIVHVHNTFLAASPSVYYAARRFGIPVVQTLHNYRLVCPAATAFRDGRPCVDCVGRAIPWPGVLHACVRDSRAQSAVIAATLTTHWARGTFRDIDSYIALTEFQRELMISGGLPPSRIRVIGNFLEPDPGIGSAERSGVVFVGRLSEEKGIKTLLEAAALAPGLVTIVGAGPLSKVVEAAARAGSVRWLGSLGRVEVLNQMGRAIALVLPSIWFEGFPLVVLEAFATATPVIASQIGSLAELVDCGATGLLSVPGNPTDLAAKIRWVAGHPGEMRVMGATARSEYEDRHRGTHHLDQLLTTYHSVLDVGPKVETSCPPPT